MTTTLELLANMIQNGKRIDELRPKCGGPANIMKHLQTLSGTQIGELFRELDQLCINLKHLAREEVVAD